MLERHQVFYRRLEPHKRGRTRIAFIAAHNRRPLFGTHRACATVGQQINNHIAGFQRKQVIVNRLQLFLTLFARGHVDRLHSFDTEWFDNSFHQGLLLRPPKHAATHNT